MEVNVIETNKGHKSILCEGFRYRLDVETKSGDVQQRDAKLEHELMLVQHWLFNKRMTIITIQTTEAMNVMFCE